MKKSLKNIIKTKRLELGLKTRELSKLVNVDQALISKFETGARLPTRNQVIILSEVLKINTEELLVLWTKERIVKEVGYDSIAEKALLLVQEEIAQYGKTVLETDKPLQEILNQIDKYKINIDKLRHLDSYRIAEALELEYTYQSNKIEGNTLTLQETNLVVHKGLTIAGKTMQEHLEAINHKDAIDFVKDLVEKDAVISERTILAIHQLILMKINSENAGKYRKVQVFISGSQFMPPQPYLVAKQMEDMMLWYNANKQSMHPVLLAAEMHERLVTIHPFIDGNGRTSRLLMNLILLKHGYVIANIKGDNENRQQYYASLEKSQTQNDKSDFIQFVARTALESIQYYHKILSPV